MFDGRTPDGFRFRIPGPLPFDNSGFVSSGVVGEIDTLTLELDADGVPVALNYVVSYTEHDRGAAHSSSDIRFSGWGAPITIGAPPG